LPGRARGRLREGAGRSFTRCVLTVTGAFVLGAWCGCREASVRSGPGATSPAPGSGGRRPDGIRATSCVWCREWGDRRRIGSVKEGVMIDSGDAEAASRHEPVLVDRVVELLSPALTEPSAIMLDATLGLGGHAAAILRRHPHVTYIGLDQDHAVLTRSRERLAGHDRLFTRQVRFDQLSDVLTELGVSTVDGILFDLGVSSVQLDDLGRGFSYAADAALDMRMDPSRPRTAADILNNYPTAELTRVLRDYGEERFAKRIAEAIVKARAEESFTNSARLVALLYDVV